MASSLPPSALQHVKGLLNQMLRIAITDGRIFIGTFAGTDKPLNILLINAEEYRIGPDENPDGRYVGQVLIPWRLVVKVEAQGEGPRNPSGDRVERGDESMYT